MKQLLIKKFSRYFSTKVNIDSLSEFDKQFYVRKSANLKNFVQKNMLNLMDKNFKKDLEDFLKEYLFESPIPFRVEFYMENDVDNQLVHINTFNSFLNDDNLKEIKVDNIDDIKSYINYIYDTLHDKMCYSESRFSHWITVAIFTSSEKNKAPTLDLDFNKIGTRRNGYLCKNKVRFYSTSTKTNDRSTLDTILFENVRSLLNNNPNNEDTQKQLETMLHNYFSDYFFNKDKIYIQGLDSAVLSSNIIQFCFDNSELSKIYLTKMKEKFNSQNLTIDEIDEFDTLSFRSYLFNLILNELKDDDFVNIILYTFFKIVTYDNLYTPGDHLDSNIYQNVEVSNAIKIGKTLTSLFIKHKYEKSDLNLKKDMSFTEFKNFIYTNKGYNYFDEPEFQMFFGSNIIHIMSQCDFITSKIIKENKQSISILTVTDKVRNLLDKNMNKPTSLPINLPMIVKPKEYTITKLGGYLLNDVEYSEPLFTSKIAYKKSSEVDPKGELYSIINNMMKTPFKINKELLDYLVLNNDKHKLIIDSNKEHEYSKIKNRTKIEERKFQQFMSEKMLEQYILKIANTFKDVPEIYFPIMLDNRGRLYPRPAYLNYQGSELAKSLLLFANPDIINRDDHSSIEYLLAYGGTCYGNGLEKKSYEARIEWVKENWDTILDFENSDLLEKADEKFLFLAFCFEIRRFNKFLASSDFEFKTYLPIQLDGTCNGFQHLALMSHELTLFDSLNLSKSSKADNPKDFYSHILTLLEGYLQEKYKNSRNEEERESFSRLLKLGLNRSNVKKIIMTKPYNSTDTTLSSYLKSSLILDKTETSKEDPSIKLNWYKVSKDSEVSVNHKDIRLMVETINEMLFVRYPRIKALNEYLNKIAILHNKLNIPIVWYLPTGLIVNQQYMKQHKKRVKPTWSSTKYLTLTITDKVKIDKQKQVRALMPNLVHSLDATTLCVLYNLFSKSSYKTKNKNINFYSVHDCYGVTAPNVESLIKHLQSTYINIYTDKNYIESFHKDIINNIYKVYGEDNCVYNEDLGIIFVNKVKYSIPKLPKVTDAVIKKIITLLNKATYMIK
uniref:DNA-directed RNA polymerase n=2 Tax=Gibberella intermedia TaxID=948311 RepID=A6N8I9_GIBIN|nr:RNA polymerase [Fusarium proliferatum]